MNKLETLFFRPLVFFTLLNVLVFSSNFIPKVFAADGIYKRINFQGKLVDPTTGVNKADSTYSITFTLYDASSSGTNLWDETQSVSTVDGVFRVALGSVDTTLGAVNFNSDSLYLGVQVGADAEMTPRIRMTAVPYAFNAEKVNGLTVTNTSDAPFASTTRLKLADGKTVSFTDTSSLTIATTGTTSITLPTSGTLFSDSGDANFLDAATGVAYSIAGSDATSGTNAGGALTIRAGNGSSTGTGGALTLAGGTSAGTDGAIDFQTDATTRWTITNAGVLQSTGAQSITTTSGDLTFNPAGSNVAFSSKNLTGVTAVDSAGALTLGGGASTSVVLGKAAQSTTLNGNVQAFTLAGSITGSGSPNITGVGAISVGTNPAAAGTLRIPNATYITARNAANSADINLIQVDSSNLVSFGANLAALTLGGAITGNSQSITGVNNLGATSVTTPTINTSSGDLSLTPAGDVSLTAGKNLTFAAGTGTQNVTINAGSTGTTATLIVKLDTSGTVITTDTSTLNNAVGVALDTKSSGQAVRVATAGVVTVTADNTVTAGDYIGVGTSTAGRAKSLGATYPSTAGIQVLGRATSGASAASTFTMLLNGSNNNVSSGGSGISTVQEGGSPITTSATIMNFTAADFIISGASGTSTVALDYTNSKIVRSDQAETITGGWTFNTLAATFTSAINANGGVTTSTTNQALNFNVNGSGDFVFNGDSDSNVQVAGTVTSTTSQDLQTITLTNQTTSGTQRGLVISQANDAAQTQTTEQLLHVLNSDLTTTVTDGIKVENNATGSTITNGLNITNTAGTITNGISITNSTGTMTAGLTISNAGTLTSSIVAPNFSVAGTGAVVAVGVNSGSGQIQGSGGLSITAGTTAITGTAGINTTGSAVTTVGNSGAQLIIAGSATSTITFNNFTVDGSGNVDAGGTLTSGTGNAFQVDASGNITTTGSGTHTFAGTIDPTNVAAFSLTGAISGSSTPNITGIGQFGGNSLAIASTAAPTVDIATVTNTGFATITNNVDAFASSIFTATGAGANNSALHAIIGNAPVDASDVINGLESTGIANTVASTTQNLALLTPALTGNTNGTLNGLNVAGITTANGAAETAILVGNNWDTGLSLGTGYTNAISINAGAMTINPTAIDVTGALAIGANSTSMTLGKAATTLTINNTAWTTTPTISGLITASAGVSLAANQDLTFTAGTGTFTLNSTVSNASDNAVNLVSSFTSTTNALTYNVVNIANFTANNNTGTDTVNGISIGNLTETNPGNVTSTGLIIGTGWDTGVSIASGGLTISAGALAINNSTGLTSNQATLIFNAGGAINIQDNLDTDGTITAGSGNTVLTDSTGNILHDALVDCADQQILKWITGGTRWGCAADATGSGSSPFNSAGGVITYATSTDILNLVMGETGDYGLKVSTSVVPTVDLVQIITSNAVTTTTGVDALAITYTQGTNGTNITGSGLDITLTPSGDAGDEIRGITLNNVTPGSSREVGIYFGSGYERDIDFSAQTDASVYLSDGGRMSFHEGGSGTEMAALTEYFSASNYGTFEANGFINIDGSYFQDNFNRPWSGGTNGSISTDATGTNRFGDISEWAVGMLGTGPTAAGTNASPCTINQNRPNSVGTTGTNYGALEIAPNTSTGTSTGTQNDAGCHINMGMSTGTHTAGILNVAKKYIQYYKIKPSANFTNAETAKGIWVGADNYATAWADNWSVTNTNSGGIWMGNAASTATNGARGTVWAGVARKGTNIKTVSCTTGTNTANILTGTAQFALMRIEARATNDIRFFIDPDVSNGISLFECNTGIQDTNMIPTVNIGPAMNVAQGTEGGNGATNLWTLYVDLYAHVQDDPRGAVGQAQSDTGLQEVVSSDQNQPAYDPISGADLAEYYKADDPNIETGDIVSMATKPGHILKSSQANDRKLLGVISESPALVMGASDVDTRMVALTGRVKVKVNNSGGKINIGDPITSSVMAGVGMRAKDPGKIIGTAMEEYDPQVTSGEIVQGTILVNLNVGYYLGDEHDTALLVQKSELSLNATSSATLNDVLGISIASASAGLNGDYIPDASSSATLTHSGDTIFDKVVRFTNTISVNGMFESLGTAMFKGPAEFFDQVIFHKKVSFEKTVEFNKDTAGYAIIKKGDRFVDVTFEQQYGSQPIISTNPIIPEITDSVYREKIVEGVCIAGETLDSCQDKVVADLFNQNVKFTLTSKNTQGFMIMLDHPALSDITFSWTAIAVKDAQTFRSKQQSNGNNVHPTLIPIVTPNQNETLITPSIVPSGFDAVESSSESAGLSN